MSAQTTIIEPSAADRTAAPFRSSDVISVSFAHFVHDTYTAFLAPILPLLIENLALTKTAAGLLSIFYQGPSLIQPLIGHLGDRFNLRLLVIVAPAVSAVLMTLLGVAPSYGWLALLLIVAGLNSAGLHAIGPVLVGLLSGRALGRGMSFWMVAGELARTFGPLLVVGAVELLTPRGLPWLAIGGVAASLALYIRMGRLPEYRPAHAEQPALAEALRRMAPVLRPVAGVIAVRALLFSALTTFLPTFLTEEGASLWLAGASLSVMEAAGVAGALGGGLISDRLGRRRVLLVMSAAAPLAVLLFLNVHGWLIFPALLLVGLTLLSTTPVVMAMVQERAPYSRALANGIYMALNFVIASLAVLAAGILADRFGLRMTYYISAGLMLIGLPFVFMLPEGEERA